MSLYEVRALQRTHDRAGFQCGEEALDIYLKTQVFQDVKRKVANCFAAAERGGLAVAGYYTLAAANSPLTELTPEELKRLPRYPSVPAIRIGRLAVDLRFQGKGPGEWLLMDAANRALKAEAAARISYVEGAAGHAGWKCFSGADVASCL